VRWLATYHSSHAGIWIQMYKMASGVPSVTYAEALDVALCYGWIDGPIRKGDELSCLREFTPRGKRSVWSQVNRAHIERLTNANRIQAAGLAAVERAKADGRWDNAYASSSTFTESVEFLAALRKSKPATAFYATLKKAQRYAFYYRLHNVKKSETKTKKIAEFICMLEREERFG
jgi:uncharacterized protein YdeI (YjbR/CyaY-like superfamily)